MPQHPEDISLASAVQIVQEQVLQRALSPFSSLASIASYWSAGREAYFQPGVARRLPEAVMHRAFSVLHLQMFYQWLELPLERQIAAVDRYLRSSKATASNEGLIRAARSFAPKSAALPERQLFEADLSIVLTLLQGSCKATEQERYSGLWRLAAAAQVLKAQPNRVKVTLRKLGEHLDVSPNYLGRLFRQRSGIVTIAGSGRA